MLAVACHIEFCTLNPMQVLLEEAGGKPKLFPSIQEADDFLVENGFVRGELETMFHYVDCDETDTVDSIIDKFWNEWNEIRKDD